MLDFDYIIFCIMLIFLFCLLIITSIYIDFNTLTRWLTSQDMENRQSSCNNQDLDLETCDNSMVSSSPTSDLPPSYENCVLESQPPTYSSIVIHNVQHICDRNQLLVLFRVKNNRKILNFPLFYLLNEEIQSGKI